MSELGGKWGKRGNLLDTPEKEERIFKKNYFSLTLFLQFHAKNR